MKIIGTGIDPGSIPPPVEYWLRDDFESGALNSRWTTTSGVVVDTWVNFGISPPPDGGNYGCRITTSQLLDCKDLPSLTEIWITAYGRVGTTGNPTYWGYLIDGSIGVTRNRIYLAQAQMEVIGGSSYGGSRSFTEYEWIKTKWYTKIDPVDGIFRFWWWDGSTWVLDIDVTGINTALKSGSIDTVVANANAPRQTNYYDEYNISKSDPGLLKVQGDNVWA